MKMNFRNASCTDVTGIGPIRSIVRSFEQKPVRAECSNGRLNDAAIGLALPLKNNLEHQRRHWHYKPSERSGRFVSSLIGDQR